MRYEDTRQLLEYTRSIDCADLPDDPATARLRDLIDVVAHDLRNRVNSINLSLHIMERQSSPENAQRITALREEIAQINDLIQTMKNGSTPCA